jgi:general stress protein CsbA
LIFLLISSGWLAGHVIIHIKENPPKFKSIEFIFLVTPCIFIFGQIFALFFTDVLIVGFIGETQRRNGALAYLALTIILIFTMYKINYFYIVRIIKSIIVMGVVLCGYGLLQVSGNDFVDWNYLL